MVLNVSIPDMDPFPAHVGLNTSIATLRRMAQGIKGVPTKQQRFMWKDVARKPQNTMRTLSIKDGDTLLLVINDQVVGKALGTWIL